jgi:DNA gyrase subunit A
VEGEGELVLSEARFAEMAAREQFILSIASDGYGKRSSSYEYRRTGRGGQGIANMDLNRGKEAPASVVASFPIESAEQIMLVTDGGKLIRSPVDGVRIVSRKTRGVLLFRVGEGERVVSVERLDEEDDDEGEEGDEAQAGEE